MASAPSSGHAPPDVVDLAAGLAAIGARGGVAAARTALTAVRPVARLPVVGPQLRRAAFAVADEGRRARARERARLEAAILAALDHEAAQAMVERALASAGLERMLVAVLESRLVPALTDRLLASPEMQAVLEHVASSPELRRALTEQSSSLAEEMVGGLRSRAETLDDAAERTVRGWLRRPRPSTG